MDDERAKGYSSLITLQVMQLYSVWRVARKKLGKSLEAKKMVQESQANIYHENSQLCHSAKGSFISRC